MTDEVRPYTLEELKQLTGASNTRYFPNVVHGLINLYLEQREETNELKMRIAELEVHSNHISGLKR